MSTDDVTSIKVINLAFGVTGDAALEAAGFVRDKDALLGPVDESRVLGDLELDSLTRLAVGVGGDGLVVADVPVEHLVDEERQLAVARVRKVEAAAHLDRLVVEQELDARLRVAVDVPEERHALALDAILALVLL